MIIIRRSFSFWNFVRNITSGAGAVLGTQALLRAVGIGSGYAAAGSASLNWVLKDGLGRLGAIGAATAVGNRYDSDPKSFFLLGDLSFELGVGIELMAPLFPTWFLLIGSLANALKSTSYMMRLPPRAAILKSFAKRENVGCAGAKIEPPTAERCRLRAWRLQREEGGGVSAPLHSPVAFARTRLPFTLFCPVPPPLAAGT